jgi:hypothetical protein
VIGTGTDDACSHTPHRAAEDEIPVTALCQPPTARDEDRDADRREQGEAVEVDRERPEVERPRRWRWDRGEDRHGGANCRDERLRVPELGRSFQMPRFDCRPEAGGLGKVKIEHLREGLHEIGARA